MTNSDSIAFATMVGDEPIFLPIWINHYSRFVAKSQLFILVDGQDRILPPESVGCQIIWLPQLAPSPGWDVARWQLITSFTATLLHRFGVVAFNDVDELLVLDPATEGTLLDALNRARDLGVISPFAVEVVHRIDLRPDALNPTQPILRQRPHCRLNASYCKPCVTSLPVTWSLGGHCSTHPDLHLDPQLYLFHLRYVDHGLLLDRQASRNAMMVTGDVAGAGWSKGRDQMTQFLQSFVEAGEPETGDFRFTWQRRRITRSWKKDPNSDFWRHDKLHNRRTYLIPDRFLDQF
jgi:hypothetical protein